MLTSNLENPSSTVVADPAVIGAPNDKRLQRISLPLPVRVEVKLDASISWNEITRLSDVSTYGAGFVLKRPIRRGRLVLLTIPMPRQLRLYDQTEAQYKVWGVVRKCLEVDAGVDAGNYSVGVAFIGQAPPPEYLLDPAKLYDTGIREPGGFWMIHPMDLDADESDLPKELRKQTRYRIPEPVTLEVLDDSGNVANSESTVTENLSLSGAAIFTQLDLPTGAFLRLCSERFNVKIISIVRGRRVGPDGITRLHIEFVDRYFPLDGIE